MKAATGYSIGSVTNWLISIHAAREGGDLVTVRGTEPNEIFQSTPPVKAATRNDCQIVAQALISIHAAREGGD